MIGVQLRCRFLCNRGGRKKIDSPMHRDSLFNDSEHFRIDSDSVCFHLLLFQCFTLDMLSFLPFGMQYVLDAQNSCTDRLSQCFVFVCPEARSRLRLNACAFLNTFIRN